MSKQIDKFRIAMDVLGEEHIQLIELANVQTDKEVRGMIEFRVTHMERILREISKRIKKAGEEDV